MISKKNLLNGKIFIIFILGFSLKTLGITKGSDTAVSIQPAAFFPAADTDNAMLGFGWFQNGFTLEDSTTSCTFNSIFPVSGNVNLNGGTLYLSTDLLFQNITQLNGLGTVIADNHTVNLSSGITAFPGDIALFENISLTLNADLTISNTIVFQGNCYIDGNGKTVIFENGGSFVVATDGSLVLKNLYLKDVQANTIMCADNSSNLILNEVCMDFIGSTTFAQGSILLQNKIDFIGTSTFYYTSSLSSTIAQGSQWQINNGMTLAIGRSENNNVQPLIFTDQSSYLEFDQSNWLITSTGMQILNGTLVFNRQVEIDIQNTSTYYGLIVGNKTLANDAILQINPDASLRFGSGSFVYNNFMPNKFQASSINATIIRGQNSNFVLNNNLVIPAVTVSVESLLTPPIINNGYLIEFQESRLKFPGLVVDLTCNSLARSVLHMDGNGDSLFFTKGMAPVPIIVSGAQNTISGNGNIEGSITLVDNNSVLSMALDGFVYSSIAMNGGSLTLLADLQLGNDVALTGSGTVNLTDYCLELGTQSLLWTSTIDWVGQYNGTINLKNNITLASTWTIDGTVIIDGNQNTLLFESTGSIIVNENAELIFSNIQLTDVATDKIRCIDDSGLVTFNNVTVNQSADFIWQYGSINFVNTVDWTGSYSFIYESVNTSTLNKNSILHVHDGVSFVIGKSSPDAVNQPFSFADETSILELESCTLSVNPNGVQFTKGTVATIRDITIDISSTSTENGLTLGDGTPEGDLNFNLYPGTSVLFPNGHVTFNLTNQQSIKSFSDSATLIRDASNVFYLANSLVLNNFTIDVSAATPLLTAPDQSLIYNNVSYKTPVGTLKVSGEQLTSSILLLRGNENVFMTAGSLPFALMVSNANNMLMGSGNSLYPIILQDNNAQLIWGMNGYALDTITLNNGTFILNSDLSLINNVMIVGPGNVVLQNNNLKLGSSNLVWSEPLVWNGSGGTIQLNADASLTGTWILSGDCVIDGQGRSTLDVSSGTIIIAPGSTLTLSNIVIKNIHDTNIQCADDTAQLIIDDVTWIQSDDYSFIQGSISFKDTNLLSGKGTVFAYESISRSTVMMHSLVTLDQGFTFSYYPQDSLSNDLIEFADSSSTMRFNNANLYCGISGIQFTNGALLFNRNSVISSDVDESTNNGITFGNDNEENDVAVTILQGSRLTLAQGSINYRNVNLASWIETDAGSNLYLKSGTILRLFQSINVGAGTINFDNAVLAQAVNAEIIGGISVVSGIGYASL